MYGNDSMNLVNCNPAVRQLRSQMSSDGVSPEFIIPVDYVSRRRESSLGDPKVLRFVRSTNQVANSSSRVANSSSHVGNISSRVGNSSTHVAAQTNAAFEEEEGAKEAPGVGDVTKIEKNESCGSISYDGDKQHHDIAYDGDKTYEDLEYDGDKSCENLEYDGDKTCENIRSMMNMASIQSTPASVDMTCTDDSVDILEVKLELNEPSSDDCDELENDIVDDVNGLKP